MKVTAEARQMGDTTFYNVSIASAEGREPFLSIKDCKLIDGRNGPFVGFPARQDKKDTTKWWPMVWASDAFQAVVIAAMREGAPAADTRTLGERKLAQSGIVRQAAPVKPGPAPTLTDMEDDLPFIVADMAEPSKARRSQRTRQG